MNDIAVREGLFKRVDAIAEVLAADVEAGDALGRLPDTTMDALRRAGLLALKLPAALGGFEAEPTLQYEVFERVAHHSAAAAWCLFIYADTLGMIGARLSEEGLARVFVGDSTPISCGGGGLRPGVLAPAPHGVRLTGKFRYGSGIHGADWVMVSGALPGENGGRGKLLNCVLARHSVTVHDTWHVHGLKATGSDDFSVEDLFVPDEMIFAVGGPPLRGGRQYRTGIVGYLGYTVPAVCGALARRALDELIDDAGNRVRGYSNRSSLSQRSAFQSFIGEADTKLAAAKALMLSNGQALMEAVDSPGSDLRARDASARAAAAYATRTATDVLQGIVRFAGGDSLRSGQFLERALRDATMASTHLLMSEVAYENHAHFLLGLPGADSMA